MGVAAGGIRFSLLGRPEEDDARSVFLVFACRLVCCSGSRCALQLPPQAQWYCSCSVLMLFYYQHKSALILFFFVF
jgi:hypothetical protein